MRIATLNTLESSIIKKAMPLTFVNDIAFAYLSEPGPSVWEIN